MPYPHRKEDLCQYISPYVYNLKMTERERWKVENEGLILAPGTQFEPVSDEEFWRLRVLHNCSPKRDMGSRLFKHKLNEICVLPSPIHYRSYQMRMHEVLVARGEKDPADLPDHLTLDEYWMLKIFKCPKEVTVAKRQTGDLLRLHMLDDVCQFTDVGAYNAEMQSRWSGTGDRPDELNNEEFVRLQIICQNESVAKEIAAEQAGQVGISPPKGEPSWTAPREFITQFAEEPPPGETMEEQAERLKTQIAQAQSELPMALAAAEKRAKTMKMIAVASAFAAGTSLLVAGALWLAGKKKRKGSRNKRRR